MAFAFLTAIKAGVHDVASRLNGLAEFVVVPKAASRDLLLQLGMDPSSLHCGFCHENLSDLSKLRAVYRVDGHLVPACDKFECAILARDQLLE